ncbi:hypothetical protein R3I93_008281 [Phoxinus phoxinus]|uniref:Uncharacterized protein n=1 Tax=Phoxinus phoxinus TaxID=58324 RepID=A0AAN9H742_9TELE
MSRRKFKPCPSCQAPNQVSRKTCSSCFAAISQKNKGASKKVTLDRKWGERVLKIEMREEWWTLPILQ